MGTRTIFDILSDTDEPKAEPKARRIVREKTPEITAENRELAEAEIAAVLERYRIVPQSDPVPVVKTGTTWDNPPGTTPCLYPDVHMRNPPGSGWGDFGSF